MKYNRLCIYVVYDKDGIIDDFIPYWLDAISKFVSHFVIVCNGFVNEEGYQKLYKFTNDVFTRENIGFDSGAIKDTLENLYGWRNILTYNELLICNDTFYGPIYSLDEMFNEMDSRNTDFWGITENGNFSMKSFQDIYSHIL